MTMNRVHLALAMSFPLLGAALAPMAAWAQTAPAAAPVAALAKVQVNEFIVTGNTLLPDALVQERLAHFKGQRDLGELRLVAASLQALYVEQGYGGVVVYVPVQKGKPGVLTLAVLEGKIARVVVLGNSRDSVAQVRRSLPKLHVGETPRPAALDAQVELANQNPARQLAVTLEPGAKQGQVDVRIAVTEQPLDHWTVGLDNTGNSQTGRLRANVGYQRGDLLGLDNTLSLQAQMAPERPDSVKVISADLRAPMYSAGLVLDVMAAYSDVDGGTTTTAAGPLQFSGSGRVYGVHLSGAMPRLGELSQHLAAGLDHRDYLNNCSITGLPAGACGSSGASVSVTPMSLAYQLQGSGANPFALDVTLIANLDPGGSHANPADFEAVRAGSASSYRMVRVDGQAQWSLPADWRLSARMAAQGTGDALVPGEQFGLGGSNAVRGYEEREVTGDQAAFGTVELYGPDIAKSVDTSGKVEHLRLLAFADGGRAWNHLGSACLGTQTQCTLESVGVGLRLAGHGLMLKLDLASTLKAGTLTEAHKEFLHAQVSYDFE